MLQGRAFVAPALQHPLRAAQAGTALDLPLVVAVSILLSV
jgi:hypothetical protein